MAIGKSILIFNALSKLACPDHIYRSQGLSCTWSNKALVKNVVGSFNIWTRVSIVRQVSRALRRFSSPFLSLCHVTWVWSVLWSIVCYCAVLVLLNQNVCLVGMVTELLSYFLLCVLVVSWLFICMCTSASPIPITGLRFMRFNGKLSPAFSCLPLLQGCVILFVGLLHGKSMLNTRDDRSSTCWYSSGASHLEWWVSS